MTNNRRLFERLTDPEPAAARRRGQDTRTLIESVVKHLRKLMNSRHGCTLIQPNYGIPDLNEFMFSLPDSLGAMKAAIKQAVEQFEPRLQSVRVQYVEDPDRPLDVHFDITAKLITENETLPISFSTKLGTSREFEITD